MGRTANYSDYLKRVCALIGIPYANLMPDETEILNGFFNKAIRLTWESYQWPELVIREERTPDENYLIPYEEVGYSTIAEVFDVYLTNPATGTLPAKVGYELVSDGIQILSYTSDETPGEYWVEYRSQVPAYEGEEYDETLPYFIGDRVYFTSEETGKGNYYDVTEDTVAGQNPDSAPDSFSLVEIPYTFFETVVHTAYADWLRADGQNDKAEQADMQAKILLDQEFDKLERQQRHIPATKFQTHLTSRPNAVSFTNSASGGGGGGGGSGAYLRVNQNLADVGDVEDSRESLKVDFSVDTASVSSSGTTYLTLQTGEHSKTYTITAGTGSGAYTAIFPLLTSNANAGDTLTVNVDMAASTNPTVEFRNAAFNGTLLLTVTGDGSGVGFHALFTFNGTGWTKTSSDFDE